MNFTTQYLLVGFVGSAAIVLTAHYADVPSLPASLENVDRVIQGNAATRAFSGFLRDKLLFEPAALPTAPGPSAPSQMQPDPGPPPELRRPTRRPGRPSPKTTRPSPPPVTSMRPSPPLSRPVRAEPALPRDPARLRAMEERLAAEIDKLKQSVVTRNPFGEAYVSTKREYVQYWQKVKRLQDARDNSGGAERMEAADELRALKGEDIRVGNAYHEAKKKYAAWNASHAAEIGPIRSKVAALEAELALVRGSLKGHEKGP
jgi:hypothetical protein